MMLIKMQDFVNAKNYAFYIFDSSQQIYVLKAVRKSTRNTIITPSYSGLLPYEKQNILFPPMYPKEYFPSEVSLITEGEISMVSIPIRSEIGFVNVGPVKKLRQKETNVLNEYSEILATPLKKMVEEYAASKKQSRTALQTRQTSNRKERMLLAKNYALYYGYGKMKELSSFDLIIVEPKAYTIPQFQELKYTNKVILTYLSLLEVHPTDSVFQDLTKEDLLIVDGEPLKNNEFGTYLVNLKSKKWMEHLLKNIQHHLEEIEADGLFLDTIGDIESQALPPNMQSIQLKAIVNFLHILKMLYPNHLLIQNNGLNTVVLETAPYIDGIFWENPPFTIEKSKEWTDLIVQRLSLLKKEFQVKVFLLLEEKIEKERKAYSMAKVIAKDKGFQLYNAPMDYLEVRPLVQDISQN
ncbi:hypothetical protein [Psychrobacillus lasiicapitis]|uniref:Uncharacterized protein n=2 Tax=Psychrobacillus lasiicapitis TaxID=1636719 RepID=A0A544T319_9BACI|nr:hypothetical protein [Psychrobacillus lasiicapitis]TQR11847.1 hypothetical protein FG382_14645 [Psychrobacillus lasiicapitis]